MKIMSLLSCIRHQHGKVYLDTEGGLQVEQGDVTARP
jgi:hypothetical protein